ncbi:hypothetical protein GCM10009613_61510 [Pseudonocardia kongjuensis]|uniref:HTH merR-type domain-containing protein n=1 Tax=Pseudonocardia kongjuensis TaxID=102227 RepID=A0ABN1YA31_9PSEU
MVIGAAPSVLINGVKSRKNAKNAEDRGEARDTLQRVARRYVSSGELARELGVTVRSVQNWTRDGLIDADHRTAGGHARYDLNRVLALLSAGRPRPRPRRN